jgi:GNAT superfamily N-acetyltransferase
MNLTFKPVPDQPGLVLKQYIELFSTCFPSATHFSAEYLSWLYWKNPEGSVVGFDAWDGERLAAHYVCIPATIALFGKTCKAMLSLNTATHPDYQGKGLFTSLAAKTYGLGASNGIECIFGVANANSTPGFLKKLNFTKIASLDAKVGFGRLQAQMGAVEKYVEFRRVWTKETLAWRLSNPINPVSLVGQGADILCLASARKPLFGAIAEIPQFDGPPVSVHRGIYPIRAYIGLVPPQRGGVKGNYFELPQVMRPSPLNLIFRPLADGLDVPTKEGILLSFLDFDAF